MPTLQVHYLPQFVREADLAGGTVVVIDVLRATTTICQALASGATSVRPFLDVGDLVRAAESEPRDEILLGGERDCEIIDGFDLGNSPGEYTANIVFGKRVFMTTTNGTAALNHTRLAERVVVASALNLSWAAEAVSSDADVHILCAGTGGHVTREDNLIAGAIVVYLGAYGMDRECNDLAEATRREWLELETTAEALGRSRSEQLALEFRNTPGGKNLIALDMDDDLPLCAEIDTLKIVPEYDPKTGVIEAP